MCGLGGSPKIPTAAPTPAPSPDAVRGAGRLEAQRRARRQGAAADFLTGTLSGSGGSVKTLMGQ